MHIAKIRILKAAPYGRLCFLCALLHKFITQAKGTKTKLLTKSAVSALTAWKAKDALPQKQAIFRIGRKLVLIRRKSC